MNMINISKYIYSVIFFFVLAFQNSCRKAAQVNPPVNGLVTQTVFEQDNTAAAALTSIYINIMLPGQLTSGERSIGFCTALLSDECTNYNVGDPALLEFYHNQLSSITNVYFWNEIYQQIYMTNAAVEGLTASHTLTPTVKQHLLGEAKFMRAFFYFYLVNLYGKVPLALSTDYRTNNTLSRVNVDSVYNQIILDLQNAQNLLNENYLTANVKAVSTERIRPTKAAATALLSRVYLYTSRWSEAETQASAIIDNGKFALDSNLNNVFLKNNAEAIWQLQPVVPGINTYDGRIYILTSAPGITEPVALSSSQINAFETGDNRLKLWVGNYTEDNKTYYYPYKYKVNNNLPDDLVTEYVMVLRLAEQYLIRAEARIQQDKIDDGIKDLNVLRKRAIDSSVIIADRLQQLPMGLSKDIALDKMKHERQVELFTEWGNRWFDLKRSGDIDARMNIITPLKGGGSWENYKSFFPIPQNEIKLNSRLEQTAGYF
jgi:starch-binding outer membrane protein, SusD/RagB family